MIIDFTAVLKDQDGKVIQDQMAAASNGGTEVPMTLGRISSYALNATFEDEKSMSGDDKFARGMLAYKIRDAADCDLKVEDIATIKKCIGKAYGPLVVYICYNLLDKN